MILFSIPVDISIGLLLGAAAWVAANWEYYFK